MLEIAKYMILGTPLFKWAGILALLCLIITLILPHMGQKGWIKNHLMWHKGFAAATLTLALLHGAMALL